MEFVGGWKGGEGRAGRFLVPVRRMGSGWVPRGLGLGVMGVVRGRGKRGVAGAAGVRRGRAVCRAEEGGQERERKRGGGMG